MDRDTSDASHQEETGHDSSGSETSSSTSTSGSSSSDETRHGGAILEEDIYDIEPDTRMTSLAQQQVS